MEELQPKAVLRTLDRICSSGAGEEREAGEILWRDGFVLGVNRLAAQIIQRFGLQNTPLPRHAASASSAAATLAA